MGSKNEKIFSQPSFRHGTILGKLPESVEIQALVDVQERMMGPLWNSMLRDLTDLFEENEVNVVDADISSCKPEKRYYEGLAIRLPRLLIQYGDFDANFRVVLTLCQSPNRPKVWSSYSMVSHEGKNGGFDAETTRKFFDYFLPLAQKIAAVKINHYIESMRSEGLDAKGDIKHSFDVRTVSVKKRELKKELAGLNISGSAYIDGLLEDRTRFVLVESCFSYLPGQIAVTKERESWFGLSIPLGHEMANFLYYRTSTDNGKSNTYLTGVCQDLGHERNVPAIGSGSLVRALSYNV